MTLIMKIITLLSFLCASFALQAQLLKEGTSIGVTFSGLGKSGHFIPYALGDPGYDGKGYFSLGITYIRPLSDRFDLEIGAEYSRIGNRFLPYPGSGENVPAAPDFYVSFIDVSAAVRFNFSNYFFFNGGALLSTDVRNTRFNKTGSILGVGAMLGVGAKYDFRNVPIGLFFNPYVKHRSIFTVFDKGYAPRVLDAGFRFGVVYNF